VVSDSLRKAREAEAMMRPGHEGNQEADGTAQEAARPRRVFPDGPELSEAQKRAQAIATADAEIAADIARDARGQVDADGRYRRCTWSDDLSSPAGVTDVF
jgi:hypothetical protein